MTNNLDEAYKHLDPIKAKALKLLELSLDVAVKRMEAGNPDGELSLSEVSKLIDVATKCPLTAVAESSMRDNVAKLELLRNQDREANSITG